jgi:hypothetical protein
MNQSNELLNLFVIRNSAENLYREISSICDSPDKDDFLTMSVQELINLYPAKINDCDSKIKLDLVKTSLEKEVDDGIKYTAFLESKIAKPIGFDPIQHLEDLRLVKPKSLANQEISDIR